VADGTTGTAERDLVIERTFDAPREAVWQAWVDADAVVQWWGPRGFTTTVHEMDVRPGGVWRFIMHGPDGTDYHNKVLYEEVAQPQRLVYSHGADDDSDFLPFHVTVTFEDQGGRTRVRLRMRFATPADRGRAIEFGAKEGGTQTMERLAEYLAKQ
jgi:uncharacterized protein YndB with AHSA1/START domain